MFLSVFNGIVAIAKAVPQIQSMIDQFIDLYTRKQLDEIQGRYVELNQKKYALMQSIQKAENDNERKVLSIILSDLYGVPDSESIH